MDKPPIKPPRLSVGDTIRLISPSHLVSEEQLQMSIAGMEALGFNVTIPDSILAQYGYFAGTDEERAEEINQAFATPEVKAIIAVRGGSGASLLLDKLDYTLIKKNPKVIAGFSDVTALLLAIHEKTGLITFHSPVAIQSWPKFSVDYFKAVLLNAETVKFTNSESEDDLIQTHEKTTTISNGSATGQIIGGNMTVISTLMGSNYLPKNWQGKILFLEDVGEEVYRIDRIFAQLKNAGILSQLAGFVAGHFNNCQELARNSFELHEVIERYIKPLAIPAFSGAMIGHQDKQFTIPQGIDVSIDANNGEIKMLTSAVV